MEARMEEEKVKGNSSILLQGTRRRVRDGGTVEERPVDQKGLRSVSVDIEATCIDGAGPEPILGAHPGL
jgi:hypothetical protein